MMRITRLIAACVLVLAAGTASAGEATDRLQAFTDGLETFRAGFVQTLYDEDQQPIRESHGKAWLQRPGLFRWEYETPYEQTIVADGSHLWIHDEDLEQVTVKKADQALGTAPIMLLSGSEPLSEQFEINDLGRREGLYWVGLRPKVKDTDFRRIFLGLDDQGLKVMELRDRFDQATQIRFHHIDRNVSIDAARFRFTPPEGADVIGDVPGAGDGGG